MTIQNIEQRLVQYFNELPSWDEKYEYLIELGRSFPACAAKYKTDFYAIKGCQCKAWLQAEQRESGMYFIADCDTPITKGFIALLISVLDGQSPQVIAVYQFDVLRQMGLLEHLSQARANDLICITEQIKRYAEAQLPVPLASSSLTIQKKILLEAQIITVLRTIFDPEVPVDVYALGLIYKIIIGDAGGVVIEMALTSPNCLGAESLLQDIKNQVNRLDDVLGVEVKVVFDPPWTKDMISEEAKLELGFL